MNPFDTAWAIVKMPYYHGTSSKNIPSILQHGLTPHAHDEGNYAGDFSYMEEDETPYEGKNRAFMAQDIRSQTPDSSPVVIEIADEAEGLGGFNFNPKYHDFAVTEAIPPEMLKVIFTGNENYPDVDSLYTGDEDPDMMRRQHLSMVANYDQRLQNQLRDSDWFKRYMALGMKRHPPFVLREGIY